MKLLSLLYCSLRGAILWWRYVEEAFPLKQNMAVAFFKVTLASFKAILAMARLPPDLTRGITL